jgi:hypothetical protein
MKANHKGFKLQIRIKENKLTITLSKIELLIQSFKTTLETIKIFVHVVLIALKVNRIKLFLINIHNIYVLYIKKTLYKIKLLEVQENNRNLS